MSPKTYLHSLLYLLVSWHPSQRQLTETWMHIIVNWIQSKCTRRIWCTCKSPFSVISSKYNLLFLENPHCWGCFARQGLLSFGLKHYSWPAECVLYIRAGTYFPGIHTFGLPEVLFFLALLAPKLQQIKKQKLQEIRSGTRWLPA